MNDFVVKNGIQLGGSAKGNASDVTLGTGAYNLEVAAYDGVSFSVAAQETNPRGLFFKPDGLKMYVVGLAEDQVFEYNLSTAWEISTATYLQAFSVASQEGFPSNVFFKPDGTKMFVSGPMNDAINEYSLSTAWDVSTASYVQNFSVVAQTGNPHSCSFKSDGTKMYVVDFYQGVFEYNLSTAWDISTASYVQIFSIAAQGGVVIGLSFKPDGTKMYTVDAVGSINEYSLSTAWDISTATYVQNFSTAAQDTSPSEVFFKPDGLKMFVIGYNNTNNAGDAIYQYSTGTSAALDLSTADAFEVTPTADVTLGFRYAPAAGNAKSFSVALTGADVGSSYDLANASYDSVSFSVAAQEGNPQGAFFKPDGTKMYIIGYAGDDVNEYDLSTAWDITTASYVQNFSVAAQASNPYGIFFKPDGARFYVISTGGVGVLEYALSTSWDISTASYVQSFSVSAQASIPYDLHFSDDGLVLFVLSVNSLKVVEYALSTAWDISTASFTTDATIYQTSDPSGVTFSTSGAKMFVVAAGNDAVFEYSLSTAWDVSTRTYIRSFSIAEDTTPRGVAFKTDGTKMYIVGDQHNTIYQYTTGSLSQATITYPSSVVWSGGTAPTTPADGVTDLLTFYTEDGGNTYYGFKVGEAMA